MQKGIKERFYDLLPQSGEGIQMNTHLINDGYYSSLDYMTFLIEVESEFDIHFSNDDLAFGCLFTPSSIIQKIEEIVNHA